MTAGKANGHMNFNFKRFFGILGVGLLIIIFPFPINYQTYCSTAKIDWEMTNLYSLMFGYQDCYNYESGKIKEMPRGYCNEHGYMGFEYSENSTTENCLLFNYTCETKHSWWW
jgi:hypothetical protein